MKIVWTVFERFEIFMKRSGEKKQKKRQNFFRLLKMIGGYFLRKHNFRFFVFATGFTILGFEFRHFKQNRVAKFQNATVQ